MKTSKKVLVLAITIVLGLGSIFICKRVGATTPEKLIPIGSSGDRMVFIYKDLETGYEYIVTKNGGVSLRYYPDEDEDMSLNSYK